MHRHIVYPGSIPLDTDILNVLKDAYYGDGWLAQAMIGVSTAVVGLTVTPTTPASLQVNVAPGAIYSLQTVDPTAYGSLGTDANQFVKQGILAAGATLTLTAPSTTGQSVNYLVQVAFSETDATPVVLPYYNAANPAVAWSGPNNTGVAQNTVRKDSCVVQLKAGSPAATGSQTTPAPDAGYTGLYVITVANGASAITSGNISSLPSAPYFPTLPQLPYNIQSGQYSYAVAGGTANALTATLSPSPAALTTGMAIWLKVTTTNTTSSPTLNVNGIGAAPIVRPGGGIVLPGDLIGIMEFVWDGANWQAPALSPVRFGTMSIFAAAGVFSFTVPAGVTRIKARVWGGGGGGSGGASTSGLNYAGTGGGGGGYSESYANVAPGQTISVVVGQGGAGGASLSTGGTGSSSSVGSIGSATGGSGGLYQPVSGTYQVNGGVGTGGYQAVGGTGGIVLANGSTGNAIGGPGGNGAGAGGQGGVASTSSPSPGVAPGGGGGGAGGPGGFTGGAGAAGLVIIEY